MEHHIKRLSSKHSFNVLFLANFIFSFHLYFVIYMNSSFVGTFIAEKLVGIVFILSSILSIFALIYSSKILERFGNYRVIFATSILEFFLFLGLAFLENAWSIILIFIISGFTIPLILFNFDIFLENYTEYSNQEKNKGKIRGIFLTITNLALIVAPLLAGLVLTNGDYRKIYLISAIFLIFFIFVIKKLKNFKDPKYHSFKFSNTLRKIISDKNLLHIFNSHFSLRIFYSWMVIYMPIYLYSYIGFSWTEIGIMTSIILLPFVLIEYPAGKIADKWLGEKELMVLGFLITSLFILFIPFVETYDFLIWTVLLFTIRLGASLIEIMSETYFFKHVSGDNNGIISMFRILSPVSYMVGPAVASIGLIFLDFKFIFIILSIMLITGLYSSLRIKDTK